MATAGTSVCLLDVGPKDAPELLPQSIPTVHVERADASLMQPASGSMKESVDQLRGQHHVLVAATPSMGETADALILAAVADAVLLVVDAGTRMADVRSSLQNFDDLSAPMLGTVLMHGKRVHPRRGKQSDVRAAPAKPVTSLASDPSTGRGTPTTAEPGGVAVTARPSGTGSTETARS
jgi:hypothetical protein